MRVEVNVLESGTEPGVSVQHQPALMMALRTGSIEVGSRRSEMMRFTFGAGEMCLVPRHVENLSNLPGRRRVGGSPDSDFRD